MILSLPFTLAHHIVTYLYPLYASYKAIVANDGGARMPSMHPHPPSQPHTTERSELEGWLMYWSVIGTMQVLETYAEWAWSWLPFYTLFKMLFTLWLVLPQTQGSTYLYIHYLGPFLRSHEDDIDIALESARAKASTTAGLWIARLWEQIRSTLLGAVGAAPPTTTPAHAPAPAPTHPPPTMHDPVAGSASQLLDLVKRYGPAAAAGVVSAMDRAAGAGAGAGAGGQSTATASATAIPSRATSSAARRRAQLEAQLQDDDAVSSSPPSSSSSSPSSSSADGHRPARGTTTTTAPQDLSGSYQLVDDQDDSAGDDATRTPSASRASSTWTGWLRGGGGGGGGGASEPRASTSPS